MFLRLLTDKYRAIFNLLTFWQALVKIAAKLQNYLHISKFFCTFALDIISTNLIFTAYGQKTQRYCYHQGWYCNCSG